MGRGVLLEEETQPDPPTILKFPRKREETGLTGDPVVGNAETTALIEMLLDRGIGSPRVRDIGNTAELTKTDRWTVS